MPELFVFKAGKYPQGDWSVERVKKFVDAYDPENNIEAPVVIGHRAFAMDDSYQNAHGWVKSLRMDNEGNVYATINDFSKEALEAIKEKKLRYISVELLEFDKIKKDDPPYLRAIALLGRDTPEILGTKIPALFSFFSGGVASTSNEKENTSTFTRKMSGDDMKILSGLAGQKDKNMQEDFAMAKTVEELEKELAESKAASANFQKELGEMKNAGRQTDANAFFAKLRDEGKLPPAMFEKAAALDARLGEEDRKEMRALFSELGVQVDLSGKHAADKKNAAPETASESGLAAQIKAFQKEKGIANFSDAAAALFQAKPELFKGDEKND